MLGSFWFLAAISCWTTKSFLAAVTVGFSVGVGFGVGVPWTLVAVTRFAYTIVSFCRLADTTGIYI